MTKASSEYDHLVAGSTSRALILVFKKDHSIYPSEKTVFAESLQD